MAKWKYILNLTNECTKAKAKTLSVQETAALIGEKATEFNELSFPDDRTLEDVAFDITDLAGVHDATFDDLDSMLSRLYDWADSRLVWIETRTLA